MKEAEMKRFGKRLLAIATPAWSRKAKQKSWTRKETSGGLG
jgi:hypothetical protein